MKMESSPTSDNGAGITYEDALAYMRLVEDSLMGSKYEEFVEILNEYRSKRISLLGLMIRMKVLLKGHRELILGLITFLPKGCETKLKEKRKGLPTSEEAHNFLNKIKTRCCKENHVYKEFISSIRAYKRNPNKSLHELFKEVAYLFKNYDDLLEEFTHYLPDTLAASRDIVPRLSTTVATTTDRTNGDEGDDSDDDLPLTAAEEASASRYNLRRLPGRQSNPLPPPPPPPYHLRSCSGGDRRKVSSRTRRERHR